METTTQWGRPIDSARPAWWGEASGIFSLSGLSASPSASLPFPPNLSHPHPSRFPHSSDLPVSRSLFASQARALEQQGGRGRGGLFLFLEKGGFLFYFKHPSKKKRERKRRKRVADQLLGPVLPSRRTPRASPQPRRRRRVPAAPWLEGAWLPRPGHLSPRALRPPHPRPRPPECSGPWTVFWEAKRPVPFRRWQTARKMPGVPLPRWVVARNILHLPLRLTLPSGEVGGGPQSTRHWRSIPWLGDPATLNLEYLEVVTCISLWLLFLTLRASLQNAPRPGKIRSPISFLAHRDRLSSFPGLETGAWAR